MMDDTNERVEPLEYRQAGDVARTDTHPWWFVPVGILLPGIALILAWMAIPSSRARIHSDVMPCLANLRGIGQGVYIYAADGDERFPPDFRTLVYTDTCTPSQFLCRSAKNSTGGLDACYVYVSGQTTKSDPRNVLVYEKRGHHGNDVANVLFVDGHAEFIKGYANVLKLVRETEARLAPTSGPAPIGEKPRGAP